MYINIYPAYHPQQVWRAFPPPRTFLPYLPQTQLHLQGSPYCSLYAEPRRASSVFLIAPPTFNTVRKHDSQATQQPAVSGLRGPEPAQYTLDDGPRDEPGTAAYYKSWAFRQKVAKGTALVPQGEGEAWNDPGEGADEDYVKRPQQTDKRKSLVMIFSRTGVRRAKTLRKMNKRTQRANRRLKFLRKLENAESLFGWD